MKIKFKIEYVIIALLLVIIVFANMEKLTTAPSVVCTAVYDPVCGVDGRTYSNDCFANEAGVEIDYEGECISSSDPNIDRETLWWYDNDNQCCQQKEFFGAYMYEGLHTFQTLEECEIEMPPAVDENDKPNLLLMLVVLIGLSFIVMVIVEKRGK